MQVTPGLLVPQLDNDYVNVIMNALDSIIIFSVIPCSVRTLSQS